MFTKHARIRMNERGITPTEVDQCIQRGSWNFRNKTIYGRYYQGLTVVYHPFSMLVITAWKGEKPQKDNIRQPIVKDKNKYRDDKHVLRSGFSRFNI